MDNLDLDFLFESHPDANLQLADPYLLSYYKDLQRRTIFITEEIGDNCYDLIKLILQWNYEDRGIEPQDRETIRIIIASMGGSLESAESLCNIIELSETPIWTMGIGCVASAASLIFLAGHKRFTYANSTFMFTDSIFQKPVEEENESTFYSKNMLLTTIQANIKTFLIEKTGITEAQYDKHCKNEWWFNTDDAFKLHICNEVSRSHYHYIKKDR